MIENIETGTAILKADKTSVAFNPILAERAAAIRKLCKRTREDIVEIGRILSKTRDDIGHIEHGDWLVWIEAEFGWSDQTARRFIHVYELSRDAQFNNLLNVDLPLSGLYLLAAPNTPDAARAEVAARIEVGAKPSCAAVAEIVSRAKNQTVDRHDRADDEDESIQECRKQHDKLFTKPSGPVNGKSSSATVTERDYLHEVWGAATDEELAEVIQGEPLDHLLALMSDNQRAKLFDLVVRQQITQASPVPTTKSNKNLLKNLTGTFQWGIGQDDPANGAQCLKIIAAKLAANKCAPKDICFAFVKPTRR
jgi:hypothetical protein